ncbi:MAG: protein-disulfide reductase DsbD [Epsilonproteobacteria bacterium]|nr:protein-disulfide reductase DsbD [Campylobacterota bacterium]
MRIAALFLFCSLLFSAPLSIKDAFDATFVPQKNGVEFILRMAKNVHVYKKSIKVYVNNKPIVVTYPKASLDVFGEEAYTKELRLFIPYKDNIKITYQGCSDVACYAPQTKVYHPKASHLRDNSVQMSSKVDNIFFAKSSLAVLASFFVFGLLLSLTPCVFPTIPILSGLIVKSLGDNVTPFRGFMVSLVYVLSMSVTYTIAGVMAALFGNNIQILFQNPYIITLFSLVFVVLAMSMFGFFEIGIPAKLQTKLSIKSTQAGQMGNILGIVIMGFLSALIVGPCVAPPLAGALIYIGESGDVLLGGSALFVMSIGMSIPLFLVGVGAGSLLPRAGVWMIAVNRFFGVVMLGVAIYMISRVIPQNIANILWGVLFVGSGLYLSPFEKMKSYKDVLSKTLGFLLVVWGTWIVIHSINPPATKSATLTWQKVTTLAELQRNLDGNVVVDFTAKWCSACKEYEEITFQDKRVINLLKHYKLIRIDVTQNSLNDQKLLHAYHLIGPPAILVFKDGRLVRKIIGYKNPDEFLKMF